MNMKISFFTLLIFTLSCNCTVKAPVDQINYPDNNLQEIIIYGRYEPKNPKEAEDYLKPLPWMGKERFIYSKSFYCYNKTEENKKKPIYNKNLKIKLYDKNGTLLVEDFLRWDGRPIPESQSVTSYLPYHEQGDRIHIVRQEGKKELILKDLGVWTQSELRKRSRLHIQENWREGWTFDEEKECHDSPPTR